MHSKSEMEFRSQNNIDEDEIGEISSSYLRNPSLVGEGGRWQDNRIGF